MIKSIYFYLFITAFSLGMWACTSKEEKYKNLTSAQFEQLIKDSTIQLVDVRTVAEYTEGYIPGSLNVNVKDEEGFPLAVDELLDKDRPVAVYCRSGRRSRTAAELLIKKGFQKVYNLDKGILNWMEEGREINKPTE
jgi:rhodanese-related sulfurtransferase